MTEEEKLYAYYEPEVFGLVGRQQKSCIKSCREKTSNHG